MAGFSGDSVNCEGEASAFHFQTSVTAGKLLSTVAMGRSEQSTDSQMPFHPALSWYVSVDHWATVLPVRTTQRRRQRA